MTDNREEFEREVLQRCKSDAVSINYNQVWIDFLYPRRSTFIDFCEVHGLWTTVDPHDPQRVAIMKSKNDRS